MFETRNILKQLNESLLIDIKENFKKNLTKIENDQKGKRKTKKLIKNITNLKLFKIYEIFNKILNLFK